MSKFLIGSDPELTPFIESNPSEAGLYLNNDRHNPLRISNNTHIHVDNVNFELSISPAANLQEWLSYNNESVLELNNFLKSIDKNLNALANPITIYPAHYEFQKLSSYVFGCQPDYNAWTNEINVGPNNTLEELSEALGKFRTAGGHIHIGIPTKLSDKVKALLIQRLDINCLPVYAVFEKGNSSNRRSLYGKAGAMRFKPYGVEYRVPGPEWFLNSNLQKLFYEAIDKSVTDLEAAIHSNKLDKFAEENTAKLYKTVHKINSANYA